MTTEIRHLFADLGLGYRYQMHIQKKSPACKQSGKNQALKQVNVALRTKP